MFKKFEDLSESKCLCTTEDSEMSAGFTNLTSTTTCTPKCIYHMRAKPLEDSIFHIKKILNFESSDD